MTVVTPCGPAVCLVSLANLHANGTRWAVAEIASTETWPVPGGDRLGVGCTTTRGLVTHGAQGESSWLLRSTKDWKSRPEPAQMWSVVTPTMVLWSPRPCLPRVPPTR